MKSRLSLGMVAGLLLMALPQGASCQTKAETSLYNKTLKKPSLKAYEKFLSKYPSSTYSKEIAFLRDSVVFYSLDRDNAQAVKDFASTYPDSRFAGRVEEIILSHNTSPLSSQEALSRVPGATDAVGWRKDNVDRILTMTLDAGGAHLQAYTLEGAKDDSFSRTIPLYTLFQGGAGSTSRVLPLEWTSTGGSRRYLHYSYINTGAVQGEKEYVEVLYDLGNDLTSQAMFYGNALSGDRIEGQSPERMEGVLPTAEVAWILSRMEENPSLVQISRADLLSDESIRWWREKNPSAETTASRVTFGALDEGSSIVQAYKKARKENGKLFNAALFDLRGYTIICAYSKTTKDYVLVWCEPVCKDKNRDKLLNSIYFEGDSTLDMFYYKGRTTFKLRLNLSSKQLRR